MGKFNTEERELIKSTVAMLTIKRIADIEIMKVIFDQTGKTKVNRHLAAFAKESNAILSIGIGL